MILEISPQELISALTPYVLGGMGIIGVLIGLIWKSNQSVIKELKSNQKDFQVSTQKNREAMLVLVTELKTGHEQHAEDIKEIKEKLKG